MEKYNPKDSNFFYVYFSKGRNSNQSFLLFILSSVEDPPIIVSDPCVPSPCGLNSQCRELNNHAVCSCLPKYIGAPPNCRPECILSSECPLDKSCINQKCKDPCPGTCGQYAKCQVVNHNPICSCNIGFTGDPFVRCIKEAESKQLL